MVIILRGRARISDPAVARARPPGAPLGGRARISDPAACPHTTRSSANLKFSIVNFQFSIPSSELGTLSIELIVATAILLGALLPLAYSIVAEKRFARNAYQHAVAMEIVDGEMETLLAGEWRRFTPGAHEYQVHAVAAQNLPPGKFVLTLDGEKLRLEWLKQGKPVPSVIREAKLK